VTDALLIESAERLFADHCTFDAVERAEAEGEAPGIWAAVAGMGLPGISVPEARGGSGGTLEDALDVLRVAGRYAAPIPLAETGVLAGWLLAGAGLSVPEAPLTVIPGNRRDTVRFDRGILSGTAHRVPWAASVAAIVALVADGASWVVVSVPVDAVRIEPATNLAGEPRDSVTFDAVRVTDVAPTAPGVDPAALRYRGALSRVALMAGALERMSEITREYTRDRRQFGKPVASFQAVQEHLVHAAQDAVVVGMAASTAARAATRGDARFEIGAAKLLANRAATSATRAAHQAHGAMGMTREYPLHHFSRRLWAWRSEYGDERYWSRTLGAEVVAAGADALYPIVTGGSVALDH